MTSSIRGSISSFWWPLMLLSGAAALTYEICWIRMFSVGLGHEMPAMAAVISAFFGGLAFGAWALDQRIRNSVRPAVWYAALEMVIGGWAIITVKLIPWINDHLGTLTGPTPGPFLHWTVAFFLPLFVLAPATVAMGATIPAMDRIVEGLRGNGRSIGAVYAANTLGAVTGTLATPFLLLPLLGFTRTVLLASSLSFFGALAAYMCFSRVSLDPTRTPATAGRDTKRIGALLFFTGVLGIGYEIVGTRVMAQVQENTVYSFASVLAVYLLGTALGAAAFQRWFINRDQRRLLTHWIGLLTVTTLLGILVLSRSPTLHMSLLLSLGPGLPSAVTTEMALAVLVFGAPTFVMGLTFSTLAQVWRDERGSVGGAISINTLGGALASPIVAPFVLPMIGSKWTLIGVSIGYLLLFLVSLNGSGHRFAPSETPKTTKRARRRAADQPRKSLQLSYALVFASLLLGSLAMVQNLRFVTPLEGGEVLEHRDGVLASVAVVTNRSGDRFLKVNDRFRMGGTNSRSNERRLGHIPLLLHPEPKSALFLGLGTGNTLAAAAVHPQLDAEAVELVPEVVGFQHYFEGSTGDLKSNPSLQILTSDARRYVRSTEKHYDVIMADLFHPARDGSGALYTREHFQAVRHRLNQKGLFCQWLPLYQMDDTCLRVIVRTFLEVFPDATAYLSTLDVNRPILGLIGSTERYVYDQNGFYQRLSDRTLRDHVVKSGMVDAFSLFGLAVASSERMRAFADGVAINTDDQPLVTFLAPAFIYGRQDPGYKTLFALLDTTLEPGQQAISATIHDGAFRNRVSKFEVARDIFLHAEADRVAKKLDSALEGYVNSAEESSDFLLASAMATMQAKLLVSKGEKHKAVLLLERLVKAQPSPSDASALLDELTAASSN